MYINRYQLSSATEVMGWNPNQCAMVGDDHSFWLLRFPWYPLYHIPYHIPTGTVVGFFFCNILMVSANNWRLVGFICPNYPKHSNICFCLLPCSKWYPHYSTTIYNSWCGYRTNYRWISPLEWDYNYYSYNGILSNGKLQVNPISPLVNSDC